MSNYEDAKLIDLYEKLQALRLHIELLLENRIEVEDYTAAVFREFKQQISKISSTIWGELHDPDWCLMDSDGIKRG